MPCQSATMCQGDLLRKVSRSLPGMLLEDYILGMGPTRLGETSATRVREKMLRGSEARIRKHARSPQHGLCDLDFSMLHPCKYDCAVLSSWRLLQVGDLLNNIIQLLLKSICARPPLETHISLLEVGAPKLSIEITCM